MTNEIDTEQQDLVGLLRASTVIRDEISLVSVSSIKQLLVVEKSRDQIGILDMTAIQECLQLILLLRQHCLSAIRPMGLGSFDVSALSLLTWQSTLPRDAS